MRRKSIRLGQAGLPWPRVLRALAAAGVAAVGFAAAFAFGKWVHRGPSAPPGMVWIPGGEFTMGTDSALGWADEKPAHRVRVSGFWMDETEVTNAQFRRFVEATGYITTAEKPPDAAEILRQSPPGTPAPPTENLVPGALVFAPTAGAVLLNDVSQWWKWTPGADWRHPEGPGSNIEGRDDHPVVHVSWEDAAAYAKWAGKRLQPRAADGKSAARTVTAEMLVCCGGVSSGCSRRKRNSSAPSRRRSSSGTSMPASEARIPAGRV